MPSEGLGSIQYSVAVALHPGHFPSDGFVINQWDSAFYLGLRKRDVPKGSGYINHVNDGFVVVQ